MANVANPVAPPPPHPTTHTHHHHTTTTTPPPPLVQAPTVDPQLFSVVPHTPADVNGGKETSSLPYSYITTGGMHGVGDRRAPSCSSTPPSFHTPRTQSLT